MGIMANGSIESLAAAYEKASDDAFRGLGAPNSNLAYVFGVKNVIQCQSRVKGQTKPFGQIISRACGDITEIQIRG